jgi:hypothetical protein
MSNPGWVGSSSSPCSPGWSRQFDAVGVGADRVSNGGRDACAATGTLMLMSEMGQAAPGPGWFSDPWYPSGMRWWAGSEWTGHTAGKPSRPISFRWLRFPLGIGAAVFMAIGISLIAWGIVAHPARFIVSPVTATARSSLTVKQCQAGHPLDVTVPWKGSPVSVKYYDDPCSRPYLPGDELQLFAGSDSPADLGPTQTWLLEPDTHNPFAIIGPTQVRSTLITFGVFALIPGVALLIGYRGIRRTGRKPRRNDSV